MTLRCVAPEFSVLPDKAGRGKGEH